MPSVPYLGVFGGPGLFFGKPGRLFVAAPLGSRPFALSGVTKDASGAALASCVVQLFRTGDDSLVAETTSDGSGNYSFTVLNNAGTFYVVAYKAGAPDVYGTTVNTLTAT